MPYFVRRKQGVDPTRFWIGDTRFPLELDLSTHSLSGVRVGGMVERLSRLGPSSDPDAAQQGTLSYYSRGLEIVEEGGLVASFRFVWAGDEAFDAFRGDCMLGGKLVQFSAATTGAQLAALIGEPYWSDPAEDETLLFYEHGPIEWQIALSSVGTLNEMILCTPPMLADPANREAYGVTQPWPPAPITA